ncbi:P-loop containing nucleoside triphosphate hydrolase protein [Fistulina hepatica ATCC 64428]|uniref:p-loop containing nucleoside triphosphate hydrolase protein n=1 Tax=Fistulina hepatica ATCC 64428 TaxID=1128425 RepID=A0A0D7A1J9_9AGAR|nr:P-loop containing nucleoside triphosphate hydrolase protein [Fistulina hepatica ATCC 64428]
MGSAFDPDDPLSAALLPPKDESPAQRRMREAAEAEAKRISDEIDAQLRSQSEAERRRPKPVKLLLLGQSESGKTATLKNFQYTYARKEWMKELLAWRCVIILNLVRNVNQILDVLGGELSAEEPHHWRDVHLTERHKLLCLRLAPLKHVQSELERRLGASATEMYTSNVKTAAPFDEETLPRKRVLQEFSINSSDGWKTALRRFRGREWPSIGNGKPQHRRSTSLDETYEIVSSCRDDMVAIWADASIRTLLVHRKLRIEESAGFFLDEADRIAARDYEPTDEDVMRARLRTLGVQEYSFVFEREGRSAGQEWRLYDVGGTRNSRSAWYPFFEDALHPLGLCTVSCFDEKLAEDRRVNRLEDSYLLWRSVVSCKLLSRTKIILFLNKCEFQLWAKLQRGARIRDSVPSFGDRKNDADTATRYFQQHFKEIMKQHSPVPRSFFVHLTSVIDAKTTAVTLAAVEESILHDYLSRADLI